MDKKQVQLDKQYEQPQISDYYAWSGQDSICLPSPKGL